MHKIGDLYTEHLPFSGKWAWHPPDNATPMSFWQLKAEVESFLLKYCLFLY